MLKNPIRKKLLGVSIIIIYVLSIIWFVLEGTNLLLQCAIIHENTLLLEQDDTRLKVLDIDTDGTMLLEDSSRVLDSEIDSYARTEIGSGVYVLSGGIMSAEISIRDAIGLGIEFVILSVFVVVLGVMLYNTFGRKIFIRPLLGVFLADLVVIDYWLGVVSSKFPVGVVFLCFGVVVGTRWLLEGLGILRF